jgi:hypothetical protein
MPDAIAGQTKSFAPGQTKLFATWKPEYAFADPASVGYMADDKSPPLKFSERTP